MTALLIEDGADIEVRGGEGRIALYVAVRSLRPRVTKLLVTIGADVNAKGVEGQTAWDIAAPRRRYVDHLKP